MMGNVCGLYRLEKRGNKAGTSTQDMRKLGVEPKANSGNKVVRPRWVDYEDFEEDVDDIGDDGFEDEAMSHRKGFRQPRNRRDFGNRTRGQYSQRENFHSVGGHAHLDDDLDAIKLKIPSFQGIFKVGEKGGLDFLLPFRGEESEIGSHRIHGLYTDLVGSKCDL